MNGVAIRPLCSRPHWAGLLAAWHYAEWGALFGDEWSLAAAEEELHDHASRERVPTTWVAECEGQPLGTVSLVFEDAAALSHLGAPWLANLLVTPQARGEGIGRALVTHAEQIARDAGFRELLLFTPRHAGWYEQLGWRTILNTSFHDDAVVVMQRTFAGAA